MQLQQLSRCLVLHKSAHRRMLGSATAIMIMLSHAVPCLSCMQLAKSQRPVIITGCLLPHSGRSMAEVVAVYFNLLAKVCMARLKCCGSVVVTVKLHCSVCPCMYEVQRACSWTSAGCDTFKACAFEDTLLISNVLMQLLGNIHA
jgi:hypothetical protein